MSELQGQTDFDTMSTAERILHVQELWDRIAAHPDRLPISGAIRDELDRRLAAHADDSAASAPWEEVRDRIRSRE